jgi:LPS export ABC transporter protein LptC
MKRARWGSGLGLVLVLGGLGCERRPAATNPSAPANPPSQVLKDFVMNDARSGAKTMTLQSVEARIYDDKKIGDVDQPLIYFYKHGQISSRLKAPIGQVHMETHEVVAWGGVTVVNSDSATLTTERLRYDPKRGKIYSEDPVRLEKPDSVTEGIGIETDPQLEVVKIRHQKARLRKRPAL